MTLYAIGDIHGQIGMLEYALEKIERDGGPDARIVFLGDLVDRGPDCRGVIELLSSGLRDGKPWTVLRGNHDRMFTRFLSPTPIVETRLPIGLDWFHERVGGAETLRSYGVEVNEDRRIWQVHQDAAEAVPQSHRDFLHGAVNMLQQDGYLFVHAGIRPGVGLDDQEEEDLVWIREPFLSSDADHGAVVVHGHTMTDTPEHHGNRIGLDTGAGRGDRLTAAVFEDGKVFVLGHDGRTPLTPR
ncbi:metallophosphoesterase family protein [Actibacterium lipolyticum]|uniref:Serine/threonine-protein phosphatase 1 n=1 Tax=Actibacterium lipolyticum TaxID=1524263 RepID=A0A238KX73_9RHOB|nr:metallophosphoesterase family protein [Actibacterium lipolyticum]SMX46666.1 Serine/threonine-protein phosphatase 1 [Actibacterium lipolyticum]